MKRIGARTPEEQLAYHVADGRAPEFDKEHPQRIALARAALDQIIEVEHLRRLTIWELGCGSGDISGPYSDSHGVVGVDVTRGSVEAIGRRWPEMGFLLSPIEMLRPMECDVVILTEVLEHLSDPLEVVRNWLPRARWSIIGHPLDEPDPPHEPGHIWSFDARDWYGWFNLGGHDLLGETEYPLGNWPAAVIGTGKRRG